MQKINVIPLVDLKANYGVIKEEVDIAVSNVMDSCYFVVS